MKIRTEKNFHNIHQNPILTIPNYIFFIKINKIQFIIIIIINCILCVYDAAADDNDYNHDDDDDDD
jgi:hypothetical protein